ncbi:glycosyl transferase family protein [Metallosphaera cuprina Ar-4]|uniref:Glycosyl transferase family protein n=1 Tax=Metallosphaera cuprina (strain Ar-4) TaxID=1006006 RepID=F4G2H8_METCR|nr:glycosyl transferase family protein [Metallosphaera cuprina Ar-4]
MNSVFNQTLDKGLYEVILTKKKEDREVDDYARKNGAKVVYEETPRLGERIYNAMQESKGNIITFLEDDDMYDENRLQVINDAFKERKIGGFRNQVILIDQFGNKTKEELKEDEILNPKTYNHRKHFMPLVNNSSIALKRDLIDPDLKSIDLVVDTYFVFTSICNKLYEGLYHVKDKLTIYRLHSLNTGNPSTLSQRVSNFGRFLHDYDLFFNKFKDCSKEVKKSLEFYRISSKLNYYRSYLLLNRKSSPDMDFTLGEKLQLLTIPASDAWSSKLNLAIKLTGLVLFLPKPIRDKIITYRTKKIFNIK